MAKKAKQTVELVKVEYDPGDKRSYGTVEIEARTPYGLLRLDSRIASDSSLEDPEVTLDGKAVPDAVDAPDPGFPHYYASSRLRARVDERKQAKEAVEEWCAAYGAYLAG